jgi:hypothetical protein
MSDRDPLEAAARAVEEEWQIDPERHGEILRRMAAAAISAFEVSSWVEAPFAPAAWEGETLLARFNSGRIDLFRLPKGYDRRESACGGVWLRPVPECPRFLDYEGFEVGGPGPGLPLDERPTGHG